MSAGYAVKRGVHDNCIYIYVGEYNPDPYHETVELVPDQVYADLDAKGKLLGIEILGLVMTDGPGDGHQSGE